MKQPFGRCLKSVIRSMTVGVMSTARRAVLLCGILLVLFAAIAWGAVQTKSPTADEPYHAVAGWLHLRQGGFRLDSEDPPLWNMWAALPNGGGSLRGDVDKQDWSALPLSTSTEYTWVVDLLFRTSGNDGESFIARSRAMMLILSVLLGAAIAGWTWGLARSVNSPPAVAACAAAALFCFDPNFLAHAALVKNDIAISLAMLGLIAVIWAVGRKLTVPRLLAMGLLSGIALTVKFTGPLVVLIGAAVLIVRALLPYPWTIINHSEKKPVRRLFFAAAAIAITAGISIAIIWVVYGLRFAPTADAQSTFDLSATIQRTVERSWQADRSVGQSLPSPTQQDLAAAKTPFVATAVQFADRHHLLPQAWLAGLLFTYQSSLVRGEFLCGQLSGTGWWWYFPFAIAVKTPLVTLAAITAALLAFAVRVKTNRSFDTLWAAAALILPSAIYLAAAMSLNLDLGLRHVLPIYPLLFALAGLCGGWLWQCKPKPARWIFSAALLGLMVESLSVYPNFIPFFNTFAGGSRGGLSLLSDSNLDWGQDLKLLAQWQQQHPQEKLYLAYFGSADPAAYGIRYTNIQSGYEFGPAPQAITSPGILAISATTLQGPYTPRLNGRGMYAPLWDFQPIGILGGSIYLFRFPPAPQDALPSGLRLIN